MSVFPGSDNAADPMVPTLARLYRGAASGSEEGWDLKRYGVLK